MLIKTMFVITISLLSTLCFVTCDKFSPDEIAAQQAIVINQSIAVIADLTAQDPTSQLIDDYITQNFGHVNDLMVGAGKVYAQQNIPLLNEIFQNVSIDIYVNGLPEAFTELAAYNSTPAGKADQPIARNKFAFTAAVFSFRCDLEQERRVAEPTPFTNEADGWNTWYTQENRTVSLLEFAATDLQKSGSVYWSNIHWMILQFVNAGFPVVDEQVKAISSSDVRAKVLWALNDNIIFLNNLADSRTTKTSS